MGKKKCFDLEMVFVIADCSAAWGKCHGQDAPVGCDVSREGQSPAAEPSEQLGAKAGGPACGERRGSHLRSVSVYIFGYLFVQKTVYC